MTPIVDWARVQEAPRWPPATTAPSKVNTGLCRDWNADHRLKCLKLRRVGTQHPVIHVVDPAACHGDHHGMRIFGWLTMSWPPDRALKWMSNTGLSRLAMRLVLQDCMTVSHLWE
jgi:hypothetical protein